MGTAAVSPEGVNRADTRMVGWYGRVSWAFGQVGPWCQPGFILDNPRTRVAGEPSTVPIHLSTVLIFQRAELKPRGQITYLEPVDAKVETRISCLLERDAGRSFLLRSLL